MSSTVIRLDDILAAGPSGDGVHRPLASGDGDLNVNLAHLDPGSRIEAHDNHEVDVLLLVLAGTGKLCVDQIEHELVTSDLAYIDRGSRRSIVAGRDGLTCLTAHRARGPLRVTGRPPARGAFDPGR